MIVSKDELKWTVNYQAARIAELSEAIGLLTTLKPDMEIDANNPVSMATQIVAHVDARFKELKAALRPFAEHIAEAEWEQYNDNTRVAVRLADLRAARAALQNKEADYVWDGDKWVYAPWNKGEENG